MKTLFFTLLLILTTSAVARENPFEATNAYEEEKARIIEMNETEEDYAVEYQQEQQYVNEMYEKMNKPQKEEPKKPKKPAVTEEKVKKMIQKAQKEVEKKAKDIAQEVVKKQPKEVEQVVYVKPRLDVVNEKELLPFVKVEYDNDKIDIISKYKVSKKITLPGEKKMVLDFNANENFYTVRQSLDSTNFPKVTVGNHKKDKFFRVVVELASTPDDYEVTYDDQKVSIVKLYE
ncbi:AMIN domain-containing protein [Halarcobacter anaerophilus]|uniref:AMIN domain-containing protein n=1 Tax=Halarcobacter anaerophilus TaxID=877500 RepID=A0A4Q0XYL9_9BACT|nr:AMIN domain-containing protein [Halarcobacter anaerophilus]QDF30246.1 AMIN domain-containing protein [Halarcobacter anaerophilus]RXJ62195.1 hypothetical protein CRV06_10540 [Halarcobacter anaerophilus]